MFHLTCDEQMKQVNVEYSTFKSDKKTCFLFPISIINNIESDEKRGQFGHECDSIEWNEKNIIFNNGETTLQINRNDYVDGGFFEVVDDWCLLMDITPLNIGSKFVGFPFNINLYRLRGTDLVIGPSHGPNYSPMGQIQGGYDRKTNQIITLNPEILEEYRKKGYSIANRLIQSDDY